MLKLAYASHKLRVKHATLSWRVWRGLQVPRRVHGFAQHTIGLVVADEPFIIRVPTKLAMQLHCDVREVANGTRTMTDLHGSYRVAACPDTIKKILFMVVAFIKVYFVGTNDGGFQ